MIYGRVVGSLWASAQHEAFSDTALKLVVPVDVRSGEVGGDTVLAVDLVGSRRGDDVLVVYEGSSSRLALASEATPCEAIVVGIVDRLDLAGGASVSAKGEATGAAAGSRKEGRDGGKDD